MKRIFIQIVLLILALATSRQTLVMYLKKESSGYTTPIIITFLVVSILLIIVFWILMKSGRKKVIAILLSIFLVSLTLYSEVQAMKSKCQSGLRSCINASDGDSCSIGFWCDKYGRICGGGSCVGVAVGKCQNEKCVVK